MSRHWCLALFSLFSVVSSISAEASVAIPENAKEGSDVTLFCKYDLKGSRLLHVKWFFNGEQFYGFERVGRPQQIYYTLPGVNVNLLQSSEEKVILQKVTRDSSGLYRCEVTTERSFQPLVGEGTMTITSATSSGLKNHRSSAAAPPRKGTFFPLFYLAEKCITVTTLLYYMYAMVNLFQGLQNA